MVSEFAPSIFILYLREKLLIKLSHRTKLSKMNKKKIEYLYKLHIDLRVVKMV